MSDYLNNRRLAVSIEFPAYTGDSPQPATVTNPTIWFGSHKDIIYPLNVVPLDAMLTRDDAISAFSWDAQFFSGTYAISNLTVKVVDKNGSLSNEITRQLVNLVGTRHAIVRVFEMHRSRQVIDVGPLMNRYDSFNSNVVATYFMMNHYFDNGLITIECKDVFRRMKTALFEDKDLVMTQAITSESTTINVINPDFDDTSGVELCEFQHDQKYSLHPGNTNQPAVCAYLRVRDSGEILALEAMQAGFPNLLTIKERELFNTVQADVSIDSTVDPRNGPQLENITYLEEYGPELLYMLLTGLSNSGPTARVLPENYHFGYDPRWVNEYSFFGDISNNGTADNLRLRILTDEPESNGKQFVENHILSPMRSVFHTNRFGQIELVKMQATVDGSEQITLDWTNVIAGSVSAYGHIKDNIYDPIVIEYDRSILDKKYKRSHGYSDAASTQINHDTDLKKFQYDTLYSAINTSSQIDKLRISLQDFYGHEHQQLTLDVLPSVWHRHIQIGHRVRVKLPKMRDDAQKEGSIAEDIDRVFMVQGMTRNIMTCALTLRLISTQERATDYARTESQYEIPKEKYPVDKTNLLDAPGIGNSTSSIVTTGQVDQYFYSGSNTIDGGRYYVLGDLTINGDLFSRCGAGGTGDLEIWVCGRLQINGKIDTSGQGCHLPGTGQTAITPQPDSRDISGGVLPLTMVAEGAYFGTPSTVGGTYSRNDNDLYALPPVDEVTGEVEEVPELHLSNECGCLRGIPPTVSGTPSSGGAASYSWEAPVGGGAPIGYAVHAGLDGAHGGGGLVIVARGGAFGPSGKVCTNGEDAPAPTYMATNGSVEIVNSGGMPGAFIWLTDGGIHDAPFDDTTIENHFDAYAGNSNITTDQIPSAVYNERRAPLTHHHFYGPTDHTINRAVAASRHQYVPQNQKLQESQDTHWLDDEADLNADNFVYLWSKKDGDGFKNLVNGLPPVPNPASRDLYIDCTAQDSGLAQDEIPMWRYDNGQWSLITGYDSTAAFMLEQCRRFAVSGLHFGSTRPTAYEVCDSWFNEDTDKTLKLGATAADDTVIYSRQYGDLGDDVLEDGNFLMHDVCEVTWQTDTNRFGGPQVYPGSFPKYPEQIVANTLFSKTIGENGTPGWLLTAIGTGAYTCLRPRRPIKIHPGEKYVVESIIYTGGLTVTNTAAEGYTVFATVFDDNGSLLWNNGTDTALGNEHFHSVSTTALTTSGWHLVHAVFTIPETLTDARYLVPNGMVHAGAGSVIVSQMHVRRLREQHIRDTTPAPLTLGAAGLNRVEFGQPSNFPANSQYDMDIRQGSRWNFSLVGTCTVSTDCQYFLNVVLMRGGVPVKIYSWDHWFESGTDQSMDADFDYIAEEYYDGFRWEFGFSAANVNADMIIDLTTDLVWAYKDFTQVESGAVNE